MSDKRHTNECNDANDRSPREVCICKRSATTQRVIFRKWRGSGDVIAFFVDQRQGPYVMSYEHVGQHGQASYPHPQTEPATANEYAGLLAELQRIGYDDLRIVKRARRSK